MSMQTMALPEVRGAFPWVRLPITVKQADALLLLPFIACFGTFGGVAAPVGGLEVIPISGSCLPAFIAELFVFAYRPYFVDDKAQRVRRIGGLVVAYRPQTTATDATGCIHGLKPCSVLPSQIAVCCTWIIRHGLATSIVE